MGGFSGAAHSRDVVPTKHVRAVGTSALTVSAASIATLTATAGRAIYGAGYYFSHTSNGAGNLTVLVRLTYEDDTTEEISSATQNQTSGEVFNLHGTLAGFLGVIGTTTAADVFFANGPATFASVTSKTVKKVEVRALHSASTANATAGIIAQEAAF